MYRLFKLTAAGLIAGPPEDFDAPDDAAAIDHVKTVSCADGCIHGCEIWERARRVAVLAFPPPA